MQHTHDMAPTIIGADIGGTFTDIVCYVPPQGDVSTRGQLRFYKVPSTPHDPSLGLLAGLQALKAENSSVVIHGSTVATNALLERKGARCALIATEGFADILEIGRQDRPALYDIFQQRAEPLIPREQRFELAERLDHMGRVLRTPNEQEIAALLQQIASCQPESIAVSLLYSFRNAQHELLLAELLKEHFPGVYVSLSTDILPQFREYERTSTVAVNAYVQPVMARYLKKLQASLHSPLRIMQSSGGSISALQAAQEPVHTVLSGPAGGVIGAFHVVQMAGYDQIMTLDMGGTSTDVALCPGSIQQTAESAVAGCPVGVQMVSIHTVGSGGGSIVRLDDGNALMVGPESAGADPGPACYGRGLDVTVTDANVVLGRIDPDHFLGGRFPIYPERAHEQISALAERMNSSAEKVALGIIQVANASMERALRTVSLEQGYDPRRFTLVPFGGAGPLHACELAEALRIPRVFIPRYPGVLSALGMILAPVVKDYVQTVMVSASEVQAADIDAFFAPLIERAQREMDAELEQMGVQENQETQKKTSVTYQRLWDLRYAGQSYELTVPADDVDPYDIQSTLQHFHEQHQQRFGHSHPAQAVQIVAVRLKAILRPETPTLPSEDFAGPSAEHALLGERALVFASGTLQARLYERESLHHGNRITGPALLIQEDSAVLVPPQWSGEIDRWGNLVLAYQTSQWQEQEEQSSKQAVPDAVSLEIFKHLFSSVAEEMGVTLGRTSYSPNIKERKDYSCACFDKQGRLIAQAAHIPVHLGAMPFSVRTAIKQFATFDPGDLIILNDPYLGGTHLPDVTLVKPVFVGEDRDGRGGELFGFVASRAHHADIGGMSPGSMPMSRELYQEGLILPPMKLAKQGVLNQEILQIFYRNSRTPYEREGDMQAQIATAAVGERRLQEMIVRYGSETVQRHAEALLAYSAQRTRNVFAQLPEQEVTFTDYLDDDGWGSTLLPISVRLRVHDGQMEVDFTGTAPQSSGCVNAVEAVTYSGVLYVVRCLVGEEVPVNEGCLDPVKIHIPVGSLLSPTPPAAVAAGNVETSQRTVDVLFGALAQLAPQLIPAASQGTMNNVSLGGQDPETGQIFAYYETIGGGMGARPGLDGLSGVHVHMSNTRNTPVEALEMELPIRVRRYTLRRGSGGSGKYRGGDGVRRELTFLVPTRVTLLTDRRVHAPYGLQGGQTGAIGINTLEHDGVETKLPGKVALDVQPGDTLVICTPGGGGFLSER